MKTTLLVCLVFLIAFAAFSYHRTRSRRVAGAGNSQKRKRAKALAERKRIGMRQEARRIVAEKAQLKSETTLAVLRRELGNMKQKKLTVAGQEIWYAEGGERGKGNVLLLHGFAGQKEGWKDFAGRLDQSGCHVVAPDLRGFGQNIHYPDAVHDLPTQTRRIRAFAKALDLAPLHLVGASLGGSIAMVYACSVDRDVLSLTLLEPLGVHAPQESDLDQFLARGMNPLTIANVAAYDNLQGFLFLHPPKVAADVKTIRAEGAAARRDLHLKIWEEITTGVSTDMINSLVPQITQSILVLQGADSRVVHPKTAELIARRAQKASAVTIEDCGHFVGVEKAAEASGHAIRFIESLA
jgi:pimeloyl-ACP methyl ester carboxylesterase